MYPLARISSQLSTQNLKAGTEQFTYMVTYTFCTLHDEQLAGNNSIVDTVY